MILELIDKAVAGGARLAKAAAIVGLSARCVIRWRQSGVLEDQRKGPATAPANKLSEQERMKVVEVANSARFRDVSPKQIVPTLADQGVYIASESSFYRVLKEQEMVKHRQPSKPASHNKPHEHVASGPCQVWSWDITYLRSPVQGMFFYLYMIVDVWSRKIMAANVFEEESMDLGAMLMTNACFTHRVDPEGLVLHSDNGGPMKGSTMLATLQKLGVVPSFSRPKVSDDNPYSESLFRTMKYRPQYPAHPFESLVDAQQWVDEFVCWYNTRHLHSSIRFVTPDDRHYDREHSILANRQSVYERARSRHPSRWSRQTRNWNPVLLVKLNPEKERAAGMHALKEAA
jgi:putative transposase